MRSFLKSFDKASVFPQHEKGRELPLWYRVKDSELRRPAALLGHYENPTGGCDTIKPLEKAFELVYALGEEHNVLYEGLFCMNHTRGAELAETFGDAMVVLQLTTSLEQCMQSINDRRAARGVGALENKKNTEGNYRRCQRYCSTMHDAGARVIKVSRKDALDALLDLL